MDKATQPLTKIDILIGRNIIPCPAYWCLTSSLMTHPPIHTQKNGLVTLCCRGKMQ